MAIEYLYGIQPVLAAMNAGKRRMMQLLVYDHKSSPLTQSDGWKQIIQKSEARHLPIQYATRMHLDRLCGAGNRHQNVALMTKPLHTLIADTSLFGSTSKQSKSPVIFMLMDVGDPHNVGAIIRSAAYFGVDHVLLSEQCSSLTATVSKASAGALEYYHACGRISIVRRPIEFIRHASECGWKTMATSLNGDAMESIPLESDPVLVVFGSEGSGVKQSILNACAYSVSISGASSGLFAPTLDSLNVSNAAAITAYHLSRRHRV